MHPTQDELIFFEKIKMAIEKDYNKRITQAALARKFHMSETKLRKRYYLIYKINIYEYIISLRIDNAKYQLSNTDRPIKKIAEAVGYNVSNLERQFKSLTGMLPIEYRRISKPI